jgi:DNA polymerase elongation subunit (family B)
MQEFIIDTEESYNEFNSMVASGEAKVLSIDGTIAKVQINSETCIIEFNNKYLPKANNIDRIVYGKDTTTNIVNISYKDEDIYYFTEKDGVVSHSILPYKHWVLSPEPFPGFTKLKGKQYYNYIKQYTVPDYNKVKGNVYKQGLYSLSNFSEAFMIKEGYTYFKGMRVQDVSLLSFDIETTGTNPNAHDARVLLITNTFRKFGKLEKKTFNVEDYETQQDMINDWSMWVIEKDPSLLVGHNIVIFDLPYIAEQMYKEDMPFILGRMDEPVIISDRESELRKDGSQSYTYKKISIFGREIVDTFFLSIKADIARKYSSYGLKAIIAAEGLEKEGRQHYDASTIKTNWSNPEERKKIIQYAEDDADDPIKLFDLMIAPFFYLTQHIPKSFQTMIESASGSQINTLMVRSYLQDGFAVAKASDGVPFEGAVSFGNVGIYKHVLKWDVASLYPSIMRHYKVFPEEKDFNGNFLAMLEYFTLARLKNKKLAKETGDRFYKDLEQSGKILINSTYGFMGASGLHYNNPKGAAAVTKYGREIITKSIEWATGHTITRVVDHISNEGKENEEKHYRWILGDKVREGKGLTLVNGDTDSISVTANREVPEAEQEELLLSLNAEFPDLISWEDDGYYPTLIVLKAKNYILWDGKKIKLKGSSLRDQKKEPALKAMLDEMINALVFNHADDAIDIYNKYIKECMEVKDISRWAAKKTITKPVLNCAHDPTARENEAKVYRAIKDVVVQEGDKVYLYPAVLESRIERKEFKNGNVKEKVIKTTGLKLVDNWSGDHDVDKLIERVYATAEILGSVLDMNKFIDYTLVKNKPLLKNIT